MKVLIVDDDAMQRMMLVDLVKSVENVEIVEAADGAEAWAALQRGLSPVLCCCDMRMPVMSGVELLRRFKANPASANVPFVFITAVTERQTIQEAIAAGATNYILKPINMTKARSSLEAAFHGIRTRYSEEPLATQRRMGVQPPRLLGYLQAFRQEVADARPLIQEQLASKDSTVARAKLETLKTGCTTLGLWHAAAMAEHLQVVDPKLVDAVLEDIEAMVDEQALRVRTEFGLPEPQRTPKPDDKPEPRKT